MRVGPFEVLRVVETTGKVQRLVARQEGPGGFQRLVVLKRFLAGGDAPEAAAQAAAREASASAMLGHPGVVRMYQFVELDGFPTLVLEHVDGVTLAEAAAEGPPLSDAAIATIAHGVFGALAAAHTARQPETQEFCPLVHGALTPEGVLLSWAGEVKVGDFRASAPGDVRDGAPPETFFAVDAYAAPEQAKEGGDALTVRSDVYRAALIAYDLFTRGDPSAPATERRLRLQPGTRVPLAERRPDLPAEVCDALERALDADVDKRSATAADVAGALASAFDLAAGRDALVERLREQRKTRTTLIDFEREETTAVVHRQAIEAQAERDLVSTGERPTVRQLAAEEDRASVNPFAPEPLPDTVPPAAAADRASNAALRRRARPMVLAVAGVCAALLVAAVVAAVRPSKVAGASLDTGSTRARARSPELSAGPAIEPAATTGAIETPPAAWQHRLYVDDVIVGDAGARVSVPCGAHVVRVGSAGPEQRVDVPCGGVVSVDLLK